jgi:hypothetical protein
MGEGHCLNFHQGLCHVHQNHPPPGLYCYQSGLLRRRQRYRYLLLSRLEVDCSEVVTSIVVCKPWPPGIPRLALRLEPPLHVVLVGVSVQFNFAKAGVAALILTVVTAAIIADFKIIFSRFEKGLQSR